RTARLLVILAAWAIPVVWLVAELGTRPSDGTVVWSSPLSGGEPWGSVVTGHDTYGDTLLLPGDVPEALDGKPLDPRPTGEVSQPGSRRGPAEGAGSGHVARCVAVASRRPSRRSRAGREEPQGLPGDGTGVPLGWCPAWILDPCPGRAVPPSAGQC